MCFQRNSGLLGSVGMKCKQLNDPGDTVSETGSVYSLNQVVRGGLAMPLCAGSLSRASDSCSTKTLRGRVRAAGSRCTFPSFSLESHQA